MIFRQLFDYDTYTYTYLVADEASREAALIDPVDQQVDLYIQLLEELDLTLKVAMDTHVHADHVTALSILRKKTDATTYLGAPGDVECSDNPLHDGQSIMIGATEIRVVHTPGHTHDSCCFLVDDGDVHYALTGDTLLIRGTGRTDFQNGSADDLYESLHNKVLSLSGDTLVYPGHDYKGCMMSTIAEEKAHNPRVLLADKAEFIEFMNNLKLDHPKYIDIAVPANLKCGERQD
jgi:glyoxylase-like metal-dependent hydrolase (beta-lactamase superfamily II)